uniref:Uncharacterized protein n=1 Tax=Triticum urartu TaxID=4572 RepID=A0A8R7QE27_TRIUA
MSGYLSPLACMLMRHASPFIMMVGNQVFATGAVQYRLLLVSLYNYVAIYYLEANYCVLNFDFGPKFSSFDHS